MIEVRRQPAHGRVAVIAVISTRNVCRVFAGCRDAVVARATGAQYLGVIYCDCRLESDGAMAILANVGRLNVQRTLASRRDPVVAAHAVVGDTGMIEYGRYPGRGIVTIVALVVR